MGAMEHAIAFSTLALTVGLAVSRPRVARTQWRVTPGFGGVVGVVTRLVAGLLRADDLLLSARVQWRPLVALTCIMLMTGVVRELGTFDRLAGRLEAYAVGAPASRLFTLVFAA